MLGVISFLSCLSIFLKNLIDNYTDSRYTDLRNVVSYCGIQILNQLSGGL